jgi:quercetin dioxygenase-like cupin family protein
MYEIKVDLNGDAVEGLTYRLTFDSRDGASNQRYVLRRLAGASATDPHAAGTVVAQGTTGEKVTTSDGLRVWAGRAGDPFWIEPDVLHAVGHAIQDGTRLSRSPCSTTSDDIQ